MYSYRYYIRKVDIMKKNFAFTLAEVLITLAIIGVVAAMTLPTLVNKYQDRVNETRYKKAVSMLSQAVQLAMAEVDSPGNMTNTTLWECGNWNNDMDDDEHLSCYRTEIKKLFKNIVVEGDWAKDTHLTNVKFLTAYNDELNMNDGYVYSFQTGDGMVFAFQVSDDEPSKRDVFVITNGTTNKTHIFGKDAYVLSIQPNGKVIDDTASWAGGGDCFYDLASCTQEQCAFLPEYGCTPTDRSPNGVYWSQDYGQCSDTPCEESQ